MGMIVYRCQDSLEGIFTAIYLAYEEKRNHEETLLSLNEEPLLFAEDIVVEPDMEKTRKVMRTLYRCFGEENYLSLCAALAAEEEDKAQAVYRTVVDGLARKAARGHLFDNLKNAGVSRAFALGRTVWREINRYKEFVRFQELENGVLYARIEPKCNVLTFLMPHFADRLPVENFMIYDVARNLFGIHPAGKQWYLLCGEEEKLLVPEVSENELKYRELFKAFCHTITIEERRNSRLQRGMLPLRFREYMTEFH